MFCGFFNPLWESLKSRLSQLTNIFRKALAYKLEYVCLGAPFSGHSWHSPVIFPWAVLGASPDLRLRSEVAPTLEPPRWQQARATWTKIEME